ncbi:hypothetical protein CLOM_g22423 [Closterium sp. NIES-68]|nr:hypothetical protein CLOM_g22423 [Closterium sp. NIES-68]GJP70233.1 hypothetical protein CLOP_g1198 [Closterium sp. NIES-67]
MDLGSSALSNGAGGPDTSLRTTSSSGSAGFVRVRRRAATHKVFQGDYLQLADENHAILKMLRKQGDQSVIFADTVAKVNRHNKIVPRLLVVTEKAVYVIERDTFRLKRRIPLDIIESLYLSELADNFLALMVPKEFDCLLVSTRKTEIVTVLVDATKTTGRELKVCFSNKFEYTIDPDTTRQVEFSQVPGGVSTRITNAI